MTKVNPSDEIKQNQTLFLTGCKIRKYFNELHNFHFSVSLQK